MLKNLIRKPLPKLDFNVTNRCNFRCIHCCFQSGESMLDEFSLVKINKILNDFKSIGGQRIDITGGEPLLRSDILDIIKVGKNLGLKLELVTNGSLLTDRKLKLFKEAGLDAVAISLDGSNHDIYKKIRLVDIATYNKVVGNIKKCVQLGFYTKVNTVVFNSNLTDIININKLCIGWGVREHGLYCFTPVGRGSRRCYEIVDPVRWIKIIRNDLSKNKDRIKFSIETPLLENSLSKKLNTSCYLNNPWHLQILPDGNVYPCAIMAFYHKPCGNLYKQSLPELWQNKKLWDGTYYKQSVLPLFKKYNACVCFNNKYKKLIASGKYKFVCMMCKYKMEDYYENAH